MRLNYRFYVEAIENYIESLEPKYLAYELLKSAIEGKTPKVLDTVLSGGYSSYRTGSRNVSSRITKLYSSPDKKVDKEVHERAIKHFTSEIVPRIAEDKKDELLRRLLRGVRQDESVEEKDVKIKKRIRVLGKKCIAEKEALDLFPKERLGEFLAESFVYAVLQEDRERAEKAPRKVAPHSEAISYDRVYPDGSIYSGGWPSGKRNGMGVLTRGIYEIHMPWKDDRPNGEAIVTFMVKGMENWVQRLNFIDGIPHGTGALITEDGEDKYTTWVDRAGIVHETYHDGNYQSKYDPSNRRIEMTGKFTDEEPHISFETHGVVRFTDTNVYLADGLYTIRFDDGETETHKGNLSMLGFELFGYGELIKKRAGIEWCRRGVFMNGMLNGYGTETFEDGSHYEGFFKEDDWQGWGKLTISHEGGEHTYICQWKHGLPHGRGKLTAPDGSSYVGQLASSGFPHGRGKAVFPDQSSYEGQWKNGGFHGRGTRIYADGSSYVGQWKKGQPHGLGTEKDADGNIAYVGVWKHGKTCGRGTHYWTDGTKAYVGEWRDGTRHGRGTEFDEAEKIIYQGEFQNDAYHGRGAKWFSDGSKYVGQWEQGSRHGRGKKIDSNGTYIGEWQNDKPHGIGIHKSADGVLYAFANGFGVEINADKLQKKTWWFEHGEYMPDSVYDWYHGDNLDGVPHGYGEHLRTSFRILLRGTWMMGKLHGTGEIVYPDGALVQGEWVEGKLAVLGRIKILYGDGGFYEGEITQDGVYHGWGKRITADGAVWDGEWDNGVFVKGEVTSESGRVICGNWLNGELNGFAVVTDPDGRVLKGIWQDGGIGSEVFLIDVQPSSEAYLGEIMNGKGKLIKADSSIFYTFRHDGLQALSGNIRYILPGSESYQGEILDGKFHGRGKSVDADGKILRGVWENDMFVGNGLCHVVYPSDYEYIGQMTDGARNGRGVLTRLDGSFIRKGNWENNRLSGEDEHVCSDGTAYRATFQDGYPIGQAYVTLVDGRKEVWEWEDGEIVSARAWSEDEGVKCKATKKPVM